MTKLRMMVVAILIVLATLSLAARPAGAYCTDSNCFRDCLNQVIRHRQLVCMH